MADLSTKTIAIIATDGFEDSELTSPADAVREAGATVKVIAPEAGTISGKKGASIDVDATTADVRGEKFDGIVLPGGTGNADALRMDEAAVEIVKKHVEAGRPLGVICHGGWILTDADVLKDRTLTSFPSLKTDLRNAGATWVDEEVHVDQGLVSSRTPDDLPAFNAKIVEEFAEGTH
ncbi:type 1 glutamine amidotransferase domain-containing protein [Corynebacterium striatum]|uniref:type 1 glutamine amidotransferase domain-containing protein n=1 Tax=Corynebacterium striatum TaxID=43770 RepID=UPI0006665092|nr:type 1 glutamine amidotransferase domain-containing protein [Corynebacterium striatum]EGT5590898.1 type 1 glutamine amidotransferase [Corynebacterium striatum]EGT5593178.1 type 1 glutamine amidotransferase [Corynebacterium striatum]MDC7105735.1 type 1 glutamine amidotransferase [Corynebacterium striatum]MDK8808035.1 type 1 glutamine amidotransferase domain-containing protein [Corynebacterium striatum]MDK8825067.1 type 1 glutamine amidotransferase domain-containing protein [Corynebacterium s